MSKKGKRLEKENDGLKRQKEATAANIIRMAEERQEFKKRSEASEKKTEKLMSIIQAMQQQGRAVPPSMVSTLDSCFSDSHGGGEGDEESDYSEDGDEDEISDFDDDEDTEEDPQPVGSSAPVPYGPERPPRQQAQPSVNGH